jgi:squalene synthase HpnC
MKPTESIMSRYKIAQSKNHYENFTLGSLVLGKELQEPIITLYAFARLGDDIADEGNHSKKERTEQIRYLQNHLKKIEFNQKINDSYFKILRILYIKYKFKINNLYRFINAFNEDINHQPYARFSDLIRYCDSAANPAGELILSLVKMDHKENVRQSNAICTALALINFAQGVVEDFDKGRIYIPKDEMKRFNLKAEDIQQRNFTKHWMRYKKYWVERNYQILEEGLGLGKKIKGRLGIEIQMVECAALLLLKRMKRNNCNLFVSPPKIKTLDWIFIFFKVVLRSL